MYEKEDIRYLYNFVTLFSIVGCNKPDASNNSSGENETLKAEKNLLDFEVTLPASLVSDSEDTLDEDAKAAGVKEIIKNNDGSITLWYDINSLQIQTRRIF